MTTPEVDRELERLFAVTRSATAPDTGARGRIRAAVALQLAAGGAAVAGARGLGKWRWWSIGGAFIGLGALGLWLSGKPSSTVTAPVAAVHSVVELPSEQPQARNEATPTSEPAAAVAPAAPANSTHADGPVPAARSAAPANKLAESSKPEPAASAAPDADPAAELQLVRAMQQALRSGNPGQALTLAGEHARRFPSGTLAQEREGVRAIARCQLAKPEARGMILEQFSQRFGSSPYAARVKAACQ